MHCSTCNVALTGLTNDGLFILMHIMAGHKIELEENERKLSAGAAGDGSAVLAYRPKSKLKKPRKRKKAKRG